MNILVIPSWYPSEFYKNNGIFFKEQAEAFEKNSVNVKVLHIRIPYRKEKVEYPFFKKNYCIENNIEVYRYVFPFSFLHRFPKMFHVFLKYMGIYLYNKEFKNQKINVIHAQSFLIGGTIGIAIKKKFGCPCIITEHSSKVLKEDLNKEQLKQLSNCVDYSNEFVCVSNNLKNKVIELTKSNKDIKVIPNPVSNIFEYKEKTKCNYFIFTSIGNLIPLKRMDLVIKAFCKAFDKEEKILLNIIGEGTERKKLQKIIDKEDRENQISLLGLLTREEVMNHLKISNVMTLLSEVETFGISYVEAAMMGNVLIASNNGGSKDIINNENGLIINDCSIENIAFVFRNILNNYDKYSPNNIAKIASEQFSEKKFVESYLELFK